MATMPARDLYVKVVAKDGSAVVNYHRVWDTSRFLSSLEKAHAKEGGTVFMASKEEYDAARK